MRYFSIYLGLLLIYGTQIGCSPDQSAAVTSLAHSKLLAASGVAIDDESHTTFILDAESGIFELRSDGTVEQIWDRPEELPLLTDICVIGGGRFVVAADGDGYIIDLAHGSAKQHFCLEPGWDPDFDDDLRHQNRAVACDLTNRIIYGQPRTVSIAQDNGPLRSEIATYSLISGEDIEWRPLPNRRFQAGGMLLLPTGNLLMGSGHQLSLFQINLGTFTPLNSLSAFGVEEIGGLTFDKQTNSLIVLDEKQGVLIEINTTSLPSPTRYQFF